MSLVEMFPGMTKTKTFCVRGPKGWSLKRVSLRGETAEAITVLRVL